MLYANFYVLIRPISAVVGKLTNTPAWTFVISAAASEDVQELEISAN